MKHFDPIEYVKQLRSTGFSQEQAELQAQTIDKAINIAIDISKQDVQNKDFSTNNSTSLIHSKIRETELRLQKEITDLRYAALRFTIWTGCSVSCVVIGAMYTLLKLMLH